MNTTVKYAFDSPSIQRALNVFAFLLAFPGIEVLGNSLYFYLFIWILYKTHKRTGKAISFETGFAKLLLLMFFFGLLSTIFQPDLMPGRSSLGYSILFSFRYLYWFAISVYFYTWYSNINMYAISKYISYGYLLQIFGFYYFSYHLDLFAVSINTGMTRNGFVFNSIALSGFMYYYLYKKFGRRSVVWVSIGLLLNLLFTDGRAGAIVGLVLVLIVYAVISIQINQLFKVFACISLLIFLMGGFKTEGIYRIGGVLAPYVETLNPRFAALLTGSGVVGDLSMDKSWLIRELMISKASEIVAARPLFGIGYGNFTRYEAPLDELHTPKYFRLTGETKQYYNTRSGHNGYAEYISETGLVGFVLFLFLILPKIFRIFLLIWTRELKHYGLQVLVLAGFFGVTIHLYSIASLTGANYWFLLGISAAILRTGSEHFASFQ